jgi:uncharacterized membrane protein
VAKAIVVGVHLDSIGFIAGFRSGALALFLDSVHDRLNFIRHITHQMRIDNISPTFRSFPRR